MHVYIKITPDLERLLNTCLNKACILVLLNLDPCSISFLIWDPRQLLSFSEHLDITWNWLSQRQLPFCNTKSI